MKEIKLKNMADFCSLCGYNDIDVEEIYNTMIKPVLLENLKAMTSEQILSVNVGVCEGCGLTNIYVNNKFEIWGGMYKNKDLLIGNINQETLTLNLNNKKI